MSWDVEPPKQETRAPASATTGRGLLKAIFKGNKDEEGDNIPTASGRLHSSDAR